MYSVFRDILRHVETHKEIAQSRNLRFIRSGSGQLFPEEISRLEELFQAPLIVGLGTTEAGWVTGNPLPPGIRKTGSVGRPLTNEVRIRHEDGHFLDPGEVGEVVVRGNSVF